MADGWDQVPVRVEALPDGLWRVFCEHDGMYIGVELTVEVAPADCVAEFITHPDGETEARIRDTANGMVLVRRGVGMLRGLAQPEPLSLAEIEGLADEELGDRVWLVLVEVLANRPADSDEATAFAWWPPLRAAYFLTRSLEWEVANGGFNQYFFNPGCTHVGKTIDAYEQLGQPGWAQIVRDAVTVAGGEEGLREAHRDGTIDSFFATYDESQLDAFDERFDQIPWGDELRVELVRANPADFVVTAEDLGSEPS